MTLIQAIREFFMSRNGTPVQLQDLYAHLPDERETSLRARIYERLGKEFQRIGKGIYVAVDGPAACVVVEADAWKAVKEIPSESVDMLLTDPPYPWLARWAAKATSRPRMRWAYEKREIDLQLGLELYRTLKKGAHAFIFVPAETSTTRPHIERLIGLLGDCGFVFNKRFIWDKLTLGMGWNGRNRHEGILFMSKGVRRPACDRAVPDVLDHPAIDARNRKHDSEKPVWILEQLIKFSTRVGELVLDCFAGSCTTGLAALGLGRNSVLIEKDPGILARAAVAAAVQ